jgi:adenylate cyclase
VRAWRVTKPGKVAPHFQDRPLDSLRPSLAVLNLSGDQRAGVVGMMLADEFANIASIHGTVDVLSRMSTRRMVLDPANDADRDHLLLRRLGAHYAVAGACAEFSGQLAITLELIHVHRNAVVWSVSRRYSMEVAIGMPQAILGELCSAALSALQAHETKQARSMPLASLESYSLLMGGVSLMHRLTRDDFARGRELLEAVAERVPRHPDAYAWLSKWHCLLSYQGWSDDPLKSAARAVDAARRALERDSQCSLALTVSGMVKTYVDRDFVEGERYYRDALEANPCDAFAWILKAALHGFKGEGSQAIEDSQRALQLSPLDPMRYYFDAIAASAAASAGDYDDAVRLAERSLRANRLHGSTLRVLVIALAMQDKVEAARRYVDDLMKLEPGFTVGRFRARAPGSDSETGKAFAHALARAGVPE